jgi:Flp pilus assembly protein TadG
MCRWALPAKASSFFRRIAMHMLKRLKREEEGQAIILVGLAMSFFLIAAVGLGIDGSNLYSQRTMAQTTADAVAQAAIMSIFDGTDTAAKAGFVAADKGTFTCDSTNTAATPCKYASLNGFSNASGDTIKLSFYNANDLPASLSTIPVSDATTDPVSVVQVTISRPVSTFLVRLAGPASSTATAIATAAIVKIVSPTPLVVTDPNNASSLTGNGNPTITICGGPTQSVQVNSSDSSGYDGRATVDLSHAGPNDTAGDCTAGTGADFGVFGGESASTAGCPSGSCPVNTGTTGKYITSSPVQDPFAGVSPPPDPNSSATLNPTTKPVPAGTDGCVQAGGCTLYSPGHYASDPNVKSVNALFAPGVYYMTKGLSITLTTGGGANDSGMCAAPTPDCPTDANTGNGVLFYDTGTLDASGFAQTSGFNITTGNNISFVGPTPTQVVNGETVPGPPYYNIAFWENRNAVAHYGNGQTSNGGAHSLGQGTGCFQVTGTIYMTNTQAIMTNKSDANYPQHVQYVNYGGNPCSTTTTQGDIIVSDLKLNGNGGAASPIKIKMKLLPYGFIKVRQVALVQ